MKTKLLFPLLLIFICSCTPVTQTPADQTPDRWTAEKAFQWQEEHGWLVGCNFTPSTAINQLEFWQEATFDPETIDRELGWAADIGFNIIRVYLHDLLWEADSSGLVNRMNQFLDITDSHGIKVMFVLFDDCWYGNPQLGPQREPAPGIHNSGWLQSPSYAAVMDPSEWPRLERYAKGVLSNFKDDERVVLWDLYNEPVNNHYLEQIFPLVRNVFHWAREVNPSQPLTIGTWKWNEENWPMNEFCLENSDIISFHNYGDYESMAKEIERHTSFGRPVLCSEYLARGRNNLFETHLPLMKKHNVSAINWGLVDGKTQTKYPWNHPLGKTDIEPWHHEIFHPDGTPYRQEEVDLIKKLTAN
ncbi:MAG: cellulase family glycosylhydrolase [Bacteroidales bacterium]